MKILMVLVCLRAQINLKAFLPEKGKLVIMEYQYGGLNADFSINSFLSF